MSDEAAKKVVEAIRAGDKAALDTLLTSEPGCWSSGHRMGHRCCY